MKGPKASVFFDMFYVFYSPYPLNLISKYVRQFRV